MSAGWQHHDRPFRRRCRAGRARNLATLALAIVAEHAGKHAVHKIVGVVPKAGREDWGVVIAASAFQYQNKIDAQGGQLQCFWDSNT